VSSPSYRLRTGLVLLHHRGQFLVGCLSGSIASVAVTEPDVPLLARFAPGCDLDQAVASLQSGRWPWPLSGPAIRHRIAQLEERGLLVTGATEGNSSPDREWTIDLCQASPAVDSHTEYRVGKNFQLEVRDAGFVARDVAGEKELLLDTRLALVLMGFANGRKLSATTLYTRQPEDADRLARAAGWLIERGLLFAASNGNSDQSTEHCQTVPLQPARGQSWREIEADGRIPIYFMPHMENHYPLALGMVFSAIRAHRGGELMQRFLPIPMTYMEPGEFMRGPYRKFGRGVWMYSNYMWSDDLNLEVSRVVKQHDPGNVCIHGGPSTPSYEQACRDFMTRHDSVDIAVHGEGELTVTEVLSCIVRDADGKLDFAPQLAEVEGITFRQPDSGELVRTKPRLRMRQPDIVPSPYAEGVFDAWQGRVEAAIIETNRGCPFKCTFCDWGSATNQKVSQFEMSRIQGEIEWIGRNRVGVLWIADANFGMLKRDLEIACQIVEVKRRFGYPREVVVNYTKNANQRLAEIIKVFSDGGIISQGIISIQTTDEKTLEVIDRKNIKTEKYDELIEVFSSLGLPLSTDLMIGLPGITPKAFDNDLQRYIDVDVAVKAYPTQLLPNSPMAHPAYMEKYRIRTDDDGYLISCASYSELELKQMKLIYHVHTAADGYSTLRYVMRYLQWEHQVPAMRLLHDLARLVRDDPDRYPAIAWVLRFFNTEKCLPGGWRAFYDQVAAFVEAEYGIVRDSALDVVLQVNESVMPDEALTYPLTVSLAHDFVAYFQTHNRLGVESVRPLSSYGPGTLTVSDPNNICRIDIEHQQYDNHQYFWELNSPVCRPQSIAERAEPVPVSPAAASF
jgi:radical SAM superfamily enzyme YgiQ (UPF0313 family)